MDTRQTIKIRPETLTIVRALADQLGMKNYTAIHAAVAAYAKANRVRIPKGK